MEEEREDSDGVLPLEILLMIASHGIECWKAMTCIPIFGRFSLTDYAMAIAEKLFKNEFRGSTYLGNMLHSFLIEGDPHGNRRYSQKIRFYNNRGVCTGERREWHRKGKLHRENDLPAQEKENGDRIWYRRGKLFREGDNPAVITKGHDGEKEERWYKDGKKHRDNDKPAVIHHGRTVEYYKNGKLHRENDQPAVITKSYSSTGGKDIREWYWKGKKHRGNDKPAFESESLQKWYYRGVQHRGDDKPAEIMSYGAKLWFREGQCYKQEGMRYNSGN